MRYAAFSKAAAALALFVGIAMIGFVAEVEKFITDATTILWHGSAYCIFHFRRCWTRRKILFPCTKPNSIRHFRLLVFYYTKKYSIPCKLFVRSLFQNFLYKFSNKQASSPHLLENAQQYQILQNKSLRCFYCRYSTLSATARVRGYRSSGCATGRLTSSTPGLTFRKCKIRASLRFFSLKFSGVTFVCLSQGVVMQFPGSEVRP